MKFEDAQSISFRCPQCGIQVGSADSGGLQEAGQEPLIEDSDLMRVSSSLKHQVDGRIGVACFFGQGACPGCSALLGYVEVMGSLSSEQELLYSLAGDSCWDADYSVHQAPRDVVVLRGRATSDGVRRIEMLAGPFRLKGSLAVPGLGVARCGGAISSDWLSHEAWVEEVWPELQRLILDGLH